MGALLTPSSGGFLLRSTPGQSKPDYSFRWNRVAPLTIVVKSPTAPAIVTPSPTGLQVLALLGGAKIRQFTVMVTPVTGSPPLGERVTVITSTPPCSPEVAPPREQKLSNAVAFQVPALTTEPLELLVIRKTPLATTVPAVLSKLPAPVTAIVSVPLVAVCGPSRLKL